MNKPLYYISLVLLVIGLSLLVAAAIQEFGGVLIFSEAPWIVGIALATIGGLMVAEFRQKQRVG